MKKFFLVITTILFLSSFSIAESSYDLLSKAKNYELEGNIVYSLYTYYDVMIQDDENSLIALENFNKISAAIKEGNPGLGTYNPFKLRDGWKSIVINYEKYWTENCRWEFSVKEIKQGNIDYDNETIDYLVSLKKKNTEKATIIDKILKTGFDKVKRDDWGFSFLNNANSIFTPEDGTPEEIYQKYGVAVTKIPGTNGKKAVIKDASDQIQVFTEAYLMFGKLAAAAGIYGDFSIVDKLYLGYKVEDDIYLKVHSGYMPLEFYADYKPEFTLKDSYSDYEKQKIIEKVTGVELTIKELNNKTPRRNCDVLAVVLETKTGKELLRKGIEDNTSEEDIISFTFEKTTNDIFEEIDNNNVNVIVDSVVLLYDQPFEIKINKTSEIQMVSNPKMIKLRTSSASLNERLRNQINK